MSASSANPAVVAPTASGLWSRIRLWGTNAFIVAVLAAIVIDVFPFVPARWRWTIEPVMLWTGLRQGSWGMFAPAPDTVNTRYTAEIVYDDGTVAQWESPQWRKLAYFRRFALSRYLEYLDSNDIAAEVSIEDYLDNLSAVQIKRSLADFIVRTHPGPHPNSQAKRVTIWRAEATIPEPGAAGWPSSRELPPFEEPEFFYQQDYQ